jgi:ArsR family transcriptional regulator, arsenate/arsenite/antimonite-responsive transcriptional repressor
MKASALFGALASPIRLRLLNLLLEQKEICVCDLCEVLGEAQPKVSRHLTVLRHAALVDVRSEGKWKFYAIAEPKTALHRALLRCVRTCLGELEDLRADQERLAQIEPRRRCE